MISRDFKIELLGRVNIVDVIDQYVPLKKAGANYVACCPFHQEKTPSFTVSPEKQFYHCFGCGAHGDAISFMMEHVGLNFTAAIEKLAADVGLSVPQEDDASFRERNIDSRQKQKRLLDLNREMADYFHHALESNAPARAYFEGRGLPPAIIRQFELGFAPAQNYYPDLQDKYPLALCVEGGIVSQKDGKVFPRFRDRVMFPIKNLEGGVIGFGGRVMAAGEPKYLNSPETPLFNKSQCLYGLFDAKNAIRKAEKVVVVEGYMDVLSLVAADIHYAVATLGTATTGEHIRLLFRFSANLYFCFDGDKAGRKAAWRALCSAMEYLRDDKALFFVFLPEGEDPDSFVKARGKKGFEEFSETKKLSLSQYFIEHLLADKNMATAEMKARVIEEAKPILANAHAPNLRFLLIQSLAEKLEIPLSELKMLIGDIEKNARSYRGNRARINRFKPIEVTPYNQKMLRWLLINPELASHIDLPDYLDYKPEIRCLLTLAEKIKQNQSLRTPAQLEEAMRETPFHELISSAIKETFRDEMSPLNVLNITEEFKQGLDRIEREIVSAEISTLKNIVKKRELTRAEDALLLRLLKI